MEVKRKEKTLAGLFYRYVALFCVNTLVLTGGVILIFIALCGLGIFLPANYAETQLTEKAPVIRRAEGTVEELIPQGCSYGVYDSDGAWLEGDFSIQEQEDAWEKYKADSIYVGDGRYYRFIPMDNGNICIVKYGLAMRYSAEKLNALLPAPEVLIPIIIFVLFILDVIFLSKRFAGKVKGQLETLSGITEKIAEDNLAFQTKPSEIKEINEVIVSLGSMKDALQDSLQKQWDMEMQRVEQLSALAHDIKTPLTVIRGNAELLEEENWPDEDKKSIAYILMNVKEIEQYLETMKRILQGSGQAEEKKTLNCRMLTEEFRETAKQLSVAGKIPVSFDMKPPEGEICCVEENILRAWSNIVSNAVERTEQERGIEISIRQRERKSSLYLVAVVRDYGTGFSERDLQHATEAFYSSDSSRHDRKHQGLGLSIAKRFAEAQGGMLEYKNSDAGEGAEVSLWIKKTN